MVSCSWTELLLLLLAESEVHPPPNDAFVFLSFFFSFFFSPLYDLLTGQFNYLVLLYLFSKIHFNEHIFIILALGFCVFIVSFTNLYENHKLVSSVPCKWEVGCHV